MSEIKCKVASITPLTEVVQKVELTPESPVEFKAGQYAMVVMGEKDMRPFSIANAAFDNSRIELHIGAEPGNSYAGEVLERMRADGIRFCADTGLTGPGPRGGVSACACLLYRQDMHGEASFHTVSCLPETCALGHWLKIRAH